jgi:UDP-glucose 4-epimerase
MSKVVVTGGAGFIGHHLVNVLVERGDQVTVIDDFSGGAFPERLNGKADCMRFDIANADTWTEKRLAFALEGVDYVFHLAALPRVQASIDDPVGTARVNIMGTLAVLDAARKEGVKRFVLASSSSIYGDSDELPLNENMPASPMSPYALDKLQSEQWCQHYSLFYNLPTVCLRFFNVYGPGADPSGAYALVVAKFLEQRRNSQKMTITGNGDQTRDFTHVRDVVQANLLAAESTEVGMGEVINIGGGRQISVIMVADLIGGDTEYIEPRLEPHDTLADIKKAEIRLGWKPEVSFEKGIAELKQLYQLQ